MTRIDLGPDASGPHRPAATWLASRPDRQPREQGADSAQRIREPRWRAAPRTSVLAPADSGASELPRDNDTCSNLEPVKILCRPSRLHLGPCPVTLREMQLEDLVRHENAHSGLAFCELAAGKSSGADLVRQILGLANATFTGPRYLVLGVRDVVGGDRNIVGLTEAGLMEAKKFVRRLTAGAIEPALQLAIEALHINGKTIGLISVEDCKDPPYLLEMDLSKSLHVGRGWMRRGTELLPLRRADLQQMFVLRLAAHEPVRLTVGFPGKIIQDELNLAALPLDEVPSELAATRVRKMLEARQASRDMLGRTDTHIDRLLHAQQFGSQQAYEDHSDQSLRTQLDSLMEQYAAADAYYEFERRAHRLDIVVCNASDTLVENVVLLLKVPRIEGIGIADKLYTIDATLTSPYPVVDSSERVFRVQALIGNVPPHTTLAAFREAPRLWVRENAVGNTLPVSCTLSGKQLLESQATTLRIRIIPLSEDEQALPRTADG